MGLMPFEHWPLCNCALKSTTLDRIKFSMPTSMQYVNVPVLWAAVVRVLSVCVCVLFPASRLLTSDAKENSKSNLTC